MEISGYAYTGETDSGRLPHQSLTNIEIYKKKFGDTYAKQEVHKIVVKDEDFMSFIVGGQQISLQTMHEQDCCEHVYADFSPMKYFVNEVEGKAINTFIVKQVIGMGFLLCFDEKKIFIPCYNVQNGYYSSDLALNIVDESGPTMINITNLVEDKID